MATDARIAKVPKPVNAGVPLSWNGVWTGVLLAPALIVVVECFVFPFLLLFAFSLGSSITGGAVKWGLTLSHFWRLVSEPLYQRIILTTIGIALEVTLATLVIGYAMAFALVTSRTRYKRFLVNLVVLPLMLSGVIRTFGWIVLLAQNGAVNSVLGQLGVIDAPFRFLGSNLGVVIGLTHILLPFMVLAIHSNLAYIPSSLADAAGGLGATPLRSFLRVTLPLSVPGIATGTLLVFIMSMGAFITPAMLGYGRVKVLPILVFEQTTTSVNLSFGAAAAITLLLITMTFLAVHKRVLRSRSEWRDRNRARGLLP
jgi:ABC-type spermidine/putrescine transport system permease subunit I